MVKKPVTLYLEEDLVEDLKERKYNISQLCNDAMRVYVTNDMGDIEISTRLSAIDVILFDLKTIMLKKQLEYDKSVADYDSMQAKRKQIEDDFRDSQQTLRLSRLIQDLNRNVIALEYNADEVESICVGILEKIREITPKFNLQHHVERLKIVLS